MNYRALKELAKQDERAFLEFSWNSNHPEQIIPEVITFANTKGRVVLVGIGERPGRASGRNTSITARPAYC